MSGPSDAQKAVETFRARVKTLETRATMDVISAYRPVYTRLQRDTRALMVIAQERGLKPWQVMRMQRLRDLERQYLKNISAFADTVGDSLTGHQRAAVGLARDATRQTVTQGIPNGVTMANLANIGLGWNELPDDAFQSFVGIAGDGAPLGDLLRDSVVGDVPGVKDAIGEGIALGKGPRETAELVRVAGGMPLARALVITRTETNRAYREATRLQYANNSQVVKGYRRMCAKDDVTCLACIALDGELYALDEPLNEHPNGRCALVPEVLDYHDLGLDIPETPRPQNARDWLSDQSSDLQRQVLGGARYDAWKAGEIQLNQLATVQRNRVWGDTAVVRPIRDLKTASGTPVRQVGAPPSALRRPPTPRAPRAAPDGDLVDPQTNLPVRGTRTAPPDIDDMDALGQAFGSQKPLEYEVIGRRTEFLDSNTMWFNRPTGLNDMDGGSLVARMIGEQEAWARAVGGAVEANYSGLSLKAAHDVNLAIERTILRHKMRPLDRISTGPVNAEHPFGSTTKAYQIGGNVHINLEMTTNGSIRGWSQVAQKSNRRTQDILANARQELTVMEADIASKRAVVQGDIERRRALMERNRGSWSPEEMARQQDALDWDLRILGNRESEWKQMIKDHKKTMEDVRSNQWSISSHTEDLGINSPTLHNTVVHEIGHFAHRRYGMFDDVSNKIVATKRKKYEYVTRINKRTGKPYTAKKWAGRYEPQKDAGKISEYATTNHAEYFAEAWADYHINNGAGITKKMREFIEEVIEANAHFPDQVLTDPFTANLGILNRVRKQGGAGL